MKPNILATLFSALVLSAPTNHAQPSEQQEQKSPAPHPVKDVTIRASIIAIPNAAAVQFSAKQDLHGKPAEALRALEKMATNRMAIPEANLAATMQFGQFAEAKSGKFTLEFDAFLSSDDKNANIRIAVTDSGHLIKSFLHVTSGATKFLGSMQNHADETMTDYIFVRVTY